MAYYVKRKPYNSKYQSVSPKFPCPTDAGVDTKGFSDAVIITWVRTYNGLDTFLTSVRDQYLKYGHLSEAQWFSVVRSLVKIQNTTIAPIQPTFLPAMVCNVPIQVNRSIAFHIRDTYKVKFGLFALKIVRIDKVYKSRYGKYRMDCIVEPDFETPVNSCRVCGKTLTDANSIATYIGPQCAKMYGGASYNHYKLNPTVFKQAFALECSKAIPAQIPLTIWNSAIKTETHNAFLDACQQFLKQTPVAVNTAVSQSVVIPTPKPAPMPRPITNTKPTPQILQEIEYRWNPNAFPMVKMQDEPNNVGQIPWTFKTIPTDFPYGTIKSQIGSVRLRMFNLNKSTFETFEPVVLADGIGLNCVSGPKIWIFVPFK